MKRFIPPSPEELELQAAKIGLPPREAQKFFCYYESKGWMVGKNLMKNWRIALTGWKLRWEETRPTQQRLPSIAQQDSDKAFKRMMNEPEPNFDP